MVRSFGFLVHVSIQSRRFGNTNVSSAENLMTISLYSCTSFAKSFATTIFAFANIFGHHHLSRDFRGGSGLSMFGFEWKTFGFENHPSLKQYIAERNKQESVVEIGMGQHPWWRDLDLSRIVRESFAALSRIFAINSKKWQSMYIYYNIIILYYRLIPVSLLAFADLSRNKFAFATFRGRGFSGVFTFANVTQINPLIKALHGGFRCMSHHFKGWLDWIGRTTR